MAEYVPFASRLYSFISILEKIFVATAAAAIGFKYLQLAGANMLLMAGLSGLAVIYFLCAFRPPEQKDAEGAIEKRGFASLLGSTVLPKVSWIACSVLAVGVLYRLLHFPGANEMIMIGTATGVCAAVIFGFLAAQGNEVAKSQLGILYRLVPMLIIASYFLMPPSV
jgi:hypothetical protein